METEDLIYKLYEYFDVNNNIELADKMGITKQTISNWKTRNSINAIKKKCKELKIYDEIFGDQNIQTINSISGGQVAQNVAGNQNNNSVSSKEKEVDDATYNLFLEAFKKAKENDDIKGLRIHLMEY